jgi:hypothetical protein
MRSLIIGVAALLAVAAPSIASADTGGDIKLTYASIDDQFDSKDNVVALSGMVITDLEHAGWRVQLNAAGSDLDHNTHSDSFSQIEVHAVYDLGQFQVGAFTGSFNNNGWNFWEYGVEGAVNFERGQISASAAIADSTNGSGIDNTTTVAASGVFFINESWSVGATVSQTDFDNFAGSVDSWGVNAAYAIPNTNFTVAAGYRRSDAEFYTDDQDFIGVSIGWSFGDGARGRAMPGAHALIPDAVAAQ